jgi:hypothetical protein
MRFDEKRNPPVAQLGQIKPAKNEILKKIVKLNGYTYACNSLTHFEYKAHAMTGNRNQVNLLTKIRENITSIELIFSGF